MPIYKFVEGFKSVEGLRNFFQRRKENSSDYHRGSLSQVPERRKEYCGCPSLDGIHYLKSESAEPDPQEVEKSEAQVEGPTEDRISALPDGILISILSLAPTREAIQTTVLSRRWKNLWTCINVLDLDEHHLLVSVSDLGNYEVRFLNYAGGLLAVHRANLDKFSLSCGGRHPQSISSWISAAIMRNVKELNLFVAQAVCGTVKLPQCLYTSDNLSIMRCGHFDMNVPDNVCLNSLKLLCIISGCFVDDRCMSKLLAGCPVLEELHIERRMWGSLPTFCVRSPYLKRLTVDDQVGRLWPDTIPPIFVINTPNLKFLNIRAMPRVLEIMYIMENPPSLVSAYIHALRADIAAQLLNLVARAAKITLNLSYGGGFPVGFLADLPHADLLSFENLTYLEATLSAAGWSILHKLLLCSPNLMSLGIKFSAHLITVQQATGLVPRCLLSHLEVVEIRNCQLDRDFELGVVKFFLENGMVLKRMVISCARDGDAAINLQPQLDAVMEFPKGSQACQINFS